MHRADGAFDPATGESMAGAGAASPFAADGLPFRDRRVGVTPLVFEAAERRRENLEQAGVDVLLEAAKAQEGASVLEGLRAQVRGIAGQVAAARQEGRAEAKAEWEEELRLRLDAERAAVLVACRQIGLERDRYFGEVEGEVVRLALGIAERVLRREATLDPMLLRACVRVALEKVQGESGTVLRVPVEAAAGWRALIAEAGDAGVEVLGDDRLASGECLLETRVGRVELGVAVQLEEIEKGFFDLLQKRPA